MLLSPLLVFIQSLQYELARTMDSADSETLRTAIRSQGARLNQQDEQLTAVCQGVRELCERHEGFQSSIGNQVCQLANQIQQLVAHLDPPRSAPPLPASDPATAPGPVPATVADTAAFVSSPLQTRAFFRRLG